MTWLSKFATDLMPQEWMGFTKKEKEKKTLINKNRMTSRNCLHLINTVIHVKGQSHSQLKHESFSVLQFGALLRLCEDLRMEEASVLMFLTLIQTHQAVLRETPLHQCLLIHGHLSLHLICNCVKQTQWRFV